MVPTRAGRWGPQCRAVVHRARRSRGGARSTSRAAGAQAVRSSIRSAMRYDYISSRLPTVARLLTVNALTAADSVLIPLQCEYYALEGLTQLLATLDLVRDHLNPDLAIKGVVLTMFDARTNSRRTLPPRSAASPRAFGCLDTIIPRNVRPVRSPVLRPADRLPRTRQPGRDSHIATCGRDADVTVAGPRRRRAVSLGRVFVSTRNEYQLLTGLGRGLGPHPAAPDDGGGAGRDLAVAHRAQPVPAPRRRGRSPLADLAASIAEHGVLQPSS